MLPKFHMWRCITCELFNYDKYDYCQACFQKSTSKSAIHLLQTEHRILFNGYIRTQIINISHVDEVPIDILDYCFAFFTIDIKSVCAEENLNFAYGSDLYNLTRKLHNNR
eukprot:873802_1